MRYLIMLAALFLSFSSTAQADCLPDDTGAPASEETDTGEEDTGKVEESGCSNVNMSNLSLIMLPIIGLAIASRRE